MLHSYIRDAEEFASTYKLVLNKDKNKIKSFNKSRMWNFPPELEYSDESKLAPWLKMEEKNQYICDKARIFFGYQEDY